MAGNKNLFSEEFLYRVFFISLVIFHLLYLLCFLDISFFNEKFVFLLNNFIQFFVCVFLMIKYNPFREPVFNKNDSFLIFTSVSFILFNLAFNFGLQAYFDNYKKYVMDKMNNTKTT